MNHRLRWALGKVSLANTDTAVGLPSSETVVGLGTAITVGSCSPAYGTVFAVSRLAGTGHSGSKHRWLANTARPGSRHRGLTSVVNTNFSHRRLADTVNSDSIHRWSLAPRIPLAVVPLTSAVDIHRSLRRSQFHGVWPP